jgi:hypothetical protein
MGYKKEFENQLSERAEMKIFKTVAAVLVSFPLVLQPVLAAEQVRVGTAQKIAKLVEGHFGTTDRKVVLRDPVYRDETITTGTESAVEFRFIDETTLTLGPDSDVIIDELVFDPSAAGNSMVVSMVQGAFKFVSGKMSSGSYLVKTPVITIAIRGTAFMVYVAANGASTVSVLEGAVTVTNLAGVTQAVNPGLSSTTSPPPAGGTPPAPSPPGPPPLAAQAAFQQMESVVATAQSSTGTAGGTAASATGGVTAGAIAAGVAIAAAVAVAVSAITSDDDSTTSTFTSTNTIQAADPCPSATCGSATPD